MKIIDEQIVCLCVKLKFYQFVYQNMEWIIAGDYASLYLRGTHND